MNITPHFILTCQNAFLSAGTNNLNMIGVFSSINTQKFPFVYPRFSLVVNMDVDAPGQHTLTTKVIAPDGSELSSSKLPVNVRGTGFQIIANFEGMKFEHPGMYELKVALDDEPVGTRPLRVNLITPPKETKNVA